MNSCQTIASGQGMLKTGYPKGPVSQMNQNSAMMAALRKKRDSLKTK